MKTKYLVQICLGNRCFQKGSQQLFTLPQYLDKDLKMRVHIEGASCAHKCNYTLNKKPPIVQINSKIYENADIGRLLAELRYLEQMHLAPGGNQSAD